MNGQLLLHVLEHADHARHHEAEQEEQHADADERHERGIGQGRGELAAEPDLLVEKIRKPVKRDLERAARLAGGDHVDVELRKDLRVRLERVGQRGAFAHRVAHRRKRRLQRLRSLPAPRARISESMSGRPDERSVASWRVAFARSPSRTRPAEREVPGPARPARAVDAPSLDLEDDDAVFFELGLDRLQALAVLDPGDASCPGR